jgi:hypothetical protein
VHKMHTQKVESGLSEMLFVCSITTLATVFIPTGSSLFGWRGGEDRHKEDVRGRRNSFNLKFSKVSGARL